MEFWKGIKGYEACISQIKRQKDKLEKHTTYPKGDSTVFKWGNTGNAQQEKSRIEKTKIPQTQQ
jgi:hypothetical protein